MTTVLERPSTRLPLIPCQEGERLFLHYLGKMDEAWTASTHVMMISDSPGAAFRNGVRASGACTIADALAIRFPFRGSFQWINRHPYYGIVSLGDSRTLTPYQFPIQPRPAHVGKKQLDDLVRSWEEEPMQFEAFYKKHFALYQGSRMHRSPSWIYAFF
jgi:hypothetical protein